MRSSQFTSRTATETRDSVRIEGHRLKIQSLLHEEDRQIKRRRKARQGRAVLAEDTDRRGTLPSLGEVGAPCVGTSEGRLEENHCGSGSGCYWTQEAQGKDGF